jgi:methylmalonyl-CoA mutase
VVAGYPKEHMENLKASGISHFIHMRSHLLETLKEFNKLLV